MSSPGFSNERKKVKKLINSYAAGSAGTAVLTGPIPGTSAFLTGIEAKMCYDIARIYGFHPSLEEAGATISGLIASSGLLKTFAVEASTWLPVIGWAIKGGIAYGACHGVGKLAMNHYENKLKNLGGIA